MYFRKIMKCVVPALTLSLVLHSVTGCTTNPYTNRSQFLLIPESQEVQMGNRAYAQALNDPKVVISKNQAEVEPVQRVAERIIAAAKQSKYAKRAESFQWEVTVIKADGTKNAWALPGGKIAFYTGIFPEAKDENGLAAIMGHEVVHALARHGAERVSQHTAADLGMRIAGAAFNMKPLTQTLAMQALGIGVLLPFSRDHESEADYIGLLLAADAGYDPREAVLLWKRMAESSKSSPPEFLSTHPAHETRIENLQKWMPEAMARYERTTKAPVSTLPSIE
ncbi:MAG: M48 family metallopeptidase [Nitrospira sp. SB0666_bin_27]|nr:M48 family metallopeptidase [Nitrospira sp. SB0666_bin_27]MYF23896.1 M48 family metallopeptidase [Nitrospira sp. SB0678_bin_10]